MLYQAIREGLKSKPKFIPITEDISSHIKDNSKDYYKSLFFYNEDHVNYFQKNYTIAGIKDTLAKRIYADFDCKENFTKAKNDALEFCFRLVDNNISDESISVYFSGSKGINVEVNVDDELNQEEFKEVVFNLSKDLETFDKVVNDPNRIIRIVNTKHPESGLYKVQLTLEELETLSEKEIKALAKEPRTSWNTKTISIPEKLKKVKKPKKEVKVVTPSIDLNFNMKPKGWKNCKWAIAQGIFGESSGERHNALLILAATCKGLGFDKEQTYYMCKSALKKQADRTGKDEFSKEELWNNIINQSVFSPNWDGGQYSCRTHPWLKHYCENLGPHKCSHNEGDTINIYESDDSFRLYAREFEKNVLTTGIIPLDREMKMMVGTSNAILAPPGVGKSSLIFHMLNHLSKNDVDSIFFSYDMVREAVYIRLIQRLTGYSQDKIFQLFKEDSEESYSIREKLKDEYKKVKFCFKSGQTLEELENTIVDTEERTGTKVKFVAIDYNALISTPMSDPTQASAMIANRLRQIANDRRVCIQTLVQPSKLYSSPADEITSYNAAKGSSTIAESLTTMLGCCRPGFDPMGNNDKYFNITCLKNRNGPLFSVDLTWDGLKGGFNILTVEQEAELEEIRKKRDETGNSDSDNW